jgi:hypothetical protein
MFRKIVFLFFFFIAALSLQAQNYDRNIGESILLNLSYAHQVPGGDLAERFGSNANLGAGLEYMTYGSNWIFGIEGNFMFGSNVKFDVLEGLRTEQGVIIGNDKFPADIQLRQRGFYIGALIGKLFSLSEKNPRSGIRVTGSVGILQHKFRIQEDPQRAVPQLLGPYEKGYDRLTNGLAFNEFVGYQYLGKNRRINFYVGFEFTQAITESRREFNFDTRMKDEGQRLDLLFGIRAGWVLPFYFGEGSEEIFY